MRRGENRARLAHGSRKPRAQGQPKALQTRDDAGCARPEQAGAVHDTTEKNMVDNCPPLFRRPYDVSQSDHGEALGQPFLSGSDRGARAALRLRYPKPVFSPGRRTDGALRPGRPLQPSLRGKVGISLRDEVGNPAPDAIGWRRCKSRMRGVKRPQNLNSATDVSRPACLSTFIRSGFASRDAGKLCLESA